MTDYREPEIRVGDVPIIEQNFVWALTAGVSPFQTRIVVPKGSNLHSSLKNVVNPTKITMNLFGGIGAPGAPEYHEIDRVYLVEYRETDDFHAVWSISDSRFAWRGMKLYCSYNKTRVSNQIGIAITTPTTDPRILRQPFDTFGTGRYLPWSINGERPWTVVEIIEDVLTKLNIPFDRNVVLNGDGDYYVENVEYEGVPLYQGLQDLLKKARLQMGILPNGKVYVFSIDYFDSSQLVNLLPQNVNKVGPGILFQQELKRLRPKKVTVHFEKKLEVWAISEEENSITYDGINPIRPNTSNPNLLDEDWTNGRAIGVINVIRMPFPYAQYKMGEFVPMGRFLQLFSIPEKDLREKWFNNLLEHSVCYALTLQSGGSYLKSNYARAMQICSAIRHHYRRVYQIDPYWMDLIKQWDARRVSVIDNFSRYTNTSPLFANCCFIPNSRVPSVAKRDAAWKVIAYNWDVDSEDFYRIKPASGTVRVEHSGLGIYSVSYPSDIDNVIQTIIPSKVDNIPEGAPTAGASGYLWMTAALSEFHICETILSVVYHAKQVGGFTFPDKYKSYEFNYTNEDGQGPDIEYLSRMEHARFPVLQPISDQGDYDITYKPDRPQNELYLSTMAACEAAKIMNFYKDRIIGTIKVAGWRDILLNGNIHSITYSFGNKGLTTEINAEYIPPDPRYEQLLPQSMINYLYRHVERNDEARFI